jgi:hypothetical protein
MPASTVRLHRVLRTKPGRLYLAFLEPGGLARLAWRPLGRQRSDPGNGQQTPGERS